MTLLGDPISSVVLLIVRLTDSVPSTVSSCLTMKVAHTLVSPELNVSVVSSNGVKSAPSVQSLPYVAITINLGTLKTLLATDEHKSLGDS